MKSVLIGRVQEQKKLDYIYNSGKPEFISVYGKRRVGKTYLVKQHFNTRLDFYVTGVYEGRMSDQLSNFNKALNQYGEDSYPQAKNWFDSFDQLKALINHTDKERVLVFIDELPWFDTPKSNFTKALELFWNSWGADQDKLMLIVCGSATTWMTKKLMGSKGGLYNRLTHSIYLSPFTLKETADFIESRSIKFNIAQIVECYMIMGGIPYYLDKLQKGLSLAQNIDALFFKKEAPLRKEYKFLFSSLFSDSQNYTKVINLLCQKNKGMTRKEILEELKIGAGSNLTEILDNLCNCEFTRKYYAFGKKERDAIYQLIDLQTLFHLRFVNEDQGIDENFWTNTTNSPLRSNWQGYAFEQVCLHHLRQIKQALSVENILTNACSWTTGKSDGSQDGAQIDLVLDRKDQIVDLCEIKYCDMLYEITKDYANKLTTRIDLFREKTKTRKALHLVMITPFGLKNNLYAGLIQNEITLDDLMKF